MANVWKIWSVVIMVILLSGCSGREARERPAGKMVVRVEVRGICSDKTVLRTYESQEKMNAVLNYLRILKSLGRADTDPERIVGDSYEIRVCYSDGAKGCYRLRADCYLSKNSRPWQMVDPGQAKQLYPLLCSMPSDMPQL